MLLSRALLLSILILLWSCGSSDSSAPGGSSAHQVAPSPSETASRFLEAIQADDTAVFRALLTEKARAALENEDGFSFNSDRVDSFEIGDEVVSGKGAEVSVVILRGGEDQEADLLLREESGFWRVHGMSVAFGDGKFTLDFEAVSEVTGALEGIGEELGRQMTEHFEEAFSEMKMTYEQGGTLEQIAAERATFEALRPVTRDEFEESWRVDVDSNGRSAFTVIEELLEPAGLTLAAGDHGDALAAPLSLRLEGVSRIQAVEEIAAAASLTPVWPELGSPGFGDEDEATDTVTFQAGPRPFPTAIAGPFLVEITELEEAAPHPIGTLRLAVRALGLERAALAYQTEMGEVLRVAKVRTETDQPLIEEAMQHWGTPEMEGGYFTYSLEKELSGLLRAVEEIDVLAGEVRFTLPVHVEQLELTEGSNDQAVEAGAVKLTDWGKDVRFEIVGTKESLEGVAVRMSPRKASGDPLGTLFGNANGWGVNLQASLQCPEPPAVVDVKLCTEELLTFEFELREIPLARFAEQPERLEPLAFDGNAPIESHLVGAIRRDGDQAEVTLRLTNRSNKDATMVMIKFFYLDANGKGLSDFPHTLNGDYDFETQTAGVLVPAHQTVEKTSFAAFLPEGAASVRFEVQEADFPDGTDWSAER